jgi:hypothetical protein
MDGLSDLINRQIGHARRAAIGLPSKCGGNTDQNREGKESKTARYSAAI